MFYGINFNELKMIGDRLRSGVGLPNNPSCPTFFIILIGITFWILTLCFSCHAQISPVISGNELTQMKITVSRGGNGDATNSVEKKIDTLPIQEVPMLEAGDRLTIRFCDKCPGRSFSDLGYTRLLVFFVNPASVANDLKNEAAINLAASKTSAEQSVDSAKAIAEIKFDGDLKLKKNLPKIYGEHRLIVPYEHSLIFLVSRGDYKDELRHIILEKQADVLKLSEQATVLSRLPEAVNFLLEVKTALATPQAVNPDFMQSFVQRAQYFRFNQTNCFQQTYLYPTDEAKLGCLVKNVNPDQLTADLQDFNFTRLAQTGAAEAVAQLRLRYQGLSIFFDAAGAAIEIIGRLFKKKPLNLQLATLQTIAPGGNKQSAAQTIGRNPSETDYLSLRQFAINAPGNAEKALIIAPLKWREREEIIQLGELQKIEVLVYCRCLHEGKNTFWLDTDNHLVKQTIKTVSIVIEKKSDSSQKLALANLPVDPADQNLTLALHDSKWGENQRLAHGDDENNYQLGVRKGRKENGTERAAGSNWQILRSWNDPVKKGEPITLKLFPNTARRECLDKIVLTDERQQKIQLAPLGEYKQDAGNQVSLHLSAKLLDKLQAGKIAVEVYENGEKTTPSGKMTFTLINK